jgi:Uncharacterized protein conserved in bacteria
LEYREPFLSDEGWTYDGTWQVRPASKIQIREGCGWLISRDGTTLFEGHFKEGLKHHTGRAFTVHHTSDDWQIAEGTWSEGERDGLFIERYESGIKKKGHYKKGDFSGLWTVEYGNGKMSKGKYNFDGKPEGVWTITQSDGKKSTGELNERG